MKRIFNDELKVLICAVLCSFICKHLYEAHHIPTRGIKHIALFYFKFFNTSNVLINNFKMRSLANALQDPLKYIIKNCKLIFCWRYVPLTPVNSEL